LCAIMHYMTGIYFRIDSRVLKSLALGVLVVYCSLFFLPNSHLQPSSYHPNNNVAISEVFGFPAYLFSSPTRPSISSYSLNKPSKLILFKEFAAVYSLSIALYCIIMPIESVTLYLSRASSHYSLAPPIA